MVSDSLVIALALTIAALVIVTLTPLRRHRRLLGAGWAIVATGLLVVAATEPRWILMVLALASTLGLLTAVFRAAADARQRQRSGPSRAAAALTAIGSLGTIGAAALAAVAIWALPTPHLPQPTGDFAVGTSRLQWDSGLPEPGTADPADSRVLVAQLWYPASEGGGAQRYLPDSTVPDALAQQAGLPEFLLDGLRFGRSNSVADAAMAEGDHPLVIFSPGLGGVRTQNSAWAEDLASNGYIVAAVDHPYDSVVVVLDDGTVIRSALNTTGDDALDQQIADELAESRADDLIAALDELQRQFATGQVVSAGHSIGGAAAILAATKDDRFDAVINIDGLPRGGQPTVPLLAIVAGGGTGSVESDRRYDAALTDVLARCGTRRVAPGAQHLSFTDAALFLPPLPALIGDGGRTAGIEFARAETLSFLADVLHTADNPCVP